ncbi:MAG: hypothetical protein ACTSPB_05500 [Candidatus Thorarchaeota archaeon]
MPVMNTTRRARLIARLEIKIAQLAAANETYLALIAQPIENYKFDSGEGRQEATRRKLEALKDQIDSLEAEIDSIYNKLEGAGIVNLNLRRR